MQTKPTQNVEYTPLNALVSEAKLLFTQAVSVRHLMGVTSSLRTAYVRDFIDDETTQEDNTTGCDCGEQESCEVCDNKLENACSIDDVIEQEQSSSPFRNVANLLTTVKKYEYISLVENAYSQIGNKPFKFKATKSPTMSKKQQDSIASSFYEFLDNFLKANEVKIDEISDAFDLSTLGEVTKTLSDSAKDQTQKAINESIVANEIVMERVFKRSNFMNKYMEVIKDTVDYPIGILWVDDKSLKRERTIQDGKLVFKHSIQADVSRIDPCYFWATEDADMDYSGRAVFKLQQFSDGDIRRWADTDISNSKHIVDEINDYLEMHPDGYKMHEAMLFNDHMLLSEGVYDVLVCRGKFKAKDIEDVGVDIPEHYKQDSYIPCEIYFSNDSILRARVLPSTDDNLGVYTTVFRRRGKSLFGYSLHEFIYPFAKLYAGAIDAIDRSVGKSVGSIIQIDLSVIEDPDKYLNKNPKTGEVTLDLSEDLIIEFDSSQTFSAPNFKGVPITVDQLPSDLNKLIPVVSFIHEQLERVSGIPSILVNGSNVSSALRTTSNFNAAFTASAKVIKSLLREGENRILKPSIQYIFDSKAASGDMKDFLLEVEPEILLSDTLAREMNEDRDLLQGVQTLAQFSQLIPQEKLAGLVNRVGREVYNLEEDLIPDTGALTSSTPSTEVKPV